MIFWRTELRRAAILPTSYFQVVKRKYTQEQDRGNKCCHSRERERVGKINVFWPLNFFFHLYLASWPETERGRCSVWEGIKCKYGWLHI